MCFCGVARACGMYDARSVCAHVCESVCVCAREIVCVSVCDLTRCRVGVRAVISLTDVCRVLLNYGTATLPSEVSGK